MGENEKSSIRYRVRLLKNRFIKNINAIWVFGILLVFTFIFAIFTIFLSIYPEASYSSTATTQYFLSAVIQSLAAILAIVVTLTLVAIQLASQNYTPRIIERFVKNNWFWGLMGIFCGSILVNLGLLMQVGNEPMVSTQLMFLSSGLVGICLFYLIFYILAVVEQLNPEKLIEDTLKDLDEDFILKLEESEISKKAVSPSKDPVLSVSDLVVKAVRNHDSTTSRVGIIEIGHRFVDICKRGLIDKKTGELLLAHILTHLTTIRRKVFDFSEDLLANELLLALRDVGKGALEVDLSDESIRDVVYSIEIIGDEAIQIKWGQTAGFAAFHIGDIATEAIKKEYLYTTSMGIRALEHIGCKAASKSYDFVIFPVFRYLEELGKLTIQENLEVEVHIISEQKALITDTRVDKIIVEEGLEDATYIHLIDAILRSLKKIEDAFSPEDKSESREFINNTIRNLKEAKKGLEKI